MNDATDGDPFVNASAHDGDVRDVAWLDADRLLSCGHRDVALWDVPTGRLVTRRPVLAELGSEVMSLAVAPDGASVAVGVRLPDPPGQSSRLVGRIELLQVAR